MWNQAVEINYQEDGLLHSITDRVSALKKDSGRELAILSSGRIIFLDQIKSIAGIGF